MQFMAWKLALSLMYKAQSAIKKIVLWTVVLISFPSVCMAQTSAPRPLGETAVLAATCVTCHSAQPSASSADIPSLSGRSAEQLQRSLQALQSGRVADATVMPQLLQGLSTQQLQALAYWFAMPQPQWAAPSKP